jgi:hypothetical protein
MGVTPLTRAVFPEYEKGIDEEQGVDGHEQVEPVVHGWIAVDFEVLRNAVVGGQGIDTL